MTGFNNLKEQEMTELKSAGLYLVVAPNGVKVTDYRIHFVHCFFLFHFLHAHFGRESQRTNVHKFMAT